MVGPDTAAGNGGNAEAAAGQLRALQLEPVKLPLSLLHQSQAQLRLRSVRSDARLLCYVLSCDVIVRCNIIICLSLRLLVV